MSEEYLLDGEYFEQAAPPPYPAQQQADATQQGDYPPQQVAYPPPQQPVMVVDPNYVYSRFPQNMNCSNCHAAIQTSVSYEAGTLTWVICASLFCITAVCCYIPFLIDECKDAVHSCPECYTFIGRNSAM